jgi:hypothetical protein
MARLAVEHVRQSESPVMHADALFELATVLQLCGKLAEALETMGESLSLHKAKGNGTGVARCEKWIAEWKKKGPAVADPAQATGPQN